MPGACRRIASRLGWPRLPQRDPHMATDIDSPYPIGTEQIERFRRDGFIRLKDVFDRCYAYDS